MNARTRFLQLFVIVNLAVAHPTLQGASRQAEFLVAHYATVWDLILLVTLLCFALPLLLLLVETPAPRSIHFALVGLFSSILILPVFKQIVEPSGTLILFAAIFAGFAFSWLVFRVPGISQTVQLVSPIALAVPLIFFLNSSVHSALSEAKRPQFANVSSKTPVIMILFDEFPLVSLLDDQGNIDEVRYPNFAQLASGSTWFRNTTTFSSITEVSLPVILSGKYPDGERLPTLKDYPDNLFTLLGGNYDMHVTEEVTQLWPQRGFSVRSFVLLIQDLTAVYLHTVLPTEFTQSLPSVTEKWTNFWNDSGENRRGIFQAFLDNLQPNGKQPELFFLHEMLPHKPWIYLPSGKEYRDYGSLVWGTSILNRGKWLNNAAIVQHFWKRHLLQVGFVDRLIGQLVAKLKSSGLYDSCLLVITSDHGIGFWPDESLRNPSNVTQQDILYVPFFMKLPGQQKGEIVDRAVETIDILPTIADALNVTIPWKVDGVSALDRSVPERKNRTRVRGNWHLTHYKSNLDTNTATFQERLKLFGARSGFSTFFKLPNPMPEPASYNFRLQLINPRVFKAVDLNSDYIPCLIPGLVHGSMEEELNLLIRINGEPRAVTRTFPMRKHLLRFGALVPESSFRQGDNQVEVIVLKESMVPQN